MTVTQTILQDVLSGTIAGVVATLITSGISFLYKKNLFFQKGHDPILNGV